MNELQKRLSDELAANHGLNKNGCLVTEYDKIHGLKVLSSTTSGRSGIGIYKKRFKLFWYRNDITGVFYVENA